MIELHSIILIRYNITAISIPFSDFQLISNSFIICINTVLSVVGRTNHNRITNSWCVLYSKPLSNFNADTFIYNIMALL